MIFVRDALKAKKTKKTKKNNKPASAGLKQAGFTLIELILVIALGAMIMLSAMVLYNKSRDAAVTDTTAKDIHTIMAGLSELRLYKGGLPAGTTWPAETANYVDQSLSAKYSYSCSSGILTITTPIVDDQAQADRLLTKLIDQNLCDTGSTSGSRKVTCVVKSFNGSAGC